MDDLDFNPNIELNQDEITNLVGVMLHPGYKIQHKIWKACVNKFINALINTSPEDDNAILARHKMAKTASILYTQYTQVLNELYEAHLNSASDKNIIDAAEGLDLGEYTTFQDGEPVI